MPDLGDAVYKAPPPQTDQLWRCLLKDDSQPDKASPSMQSTRHHWGVKIGRRLGTTMSRYFAYSCVGYEETKTKHNHRVPSAVMSGLVAIKGQRAMGVSHGKQHIITQETPGPER